MRARARAAGGGFGHRSSCRRTVVPVDRTGVGVECANVAEGCSNVRHVADGLRCTWSGEAADYWRHVIHLYRGSTRAAAGAIRDADTQAVRIRRRPGRIIVAILV